jgi:hypothetical protein
VLAALEGRPPQALGLRLLEGRSREDCAAFFGISPGAFDVMLLRAARELEQAALPGPAQPLLPSGEERHQAAQLARVLEGDALPEAELAPEVKRDARLLRHLREHAPEVKAALDALQREAESSPKAKRDLWIRRGLVVLLIASALYLYGRQQAPSPPPGPPSPVEPRKDRP